MGPPVRDHDSGGREPGQRGAGQPLQPGHQEGGGRGGGDSEAASLLSASQ